MLANVASGKFTGEHYQRMWSERCQDAGVDLSAAAAAPPRRASRAEATPAAPERRRALGEAASYFGSRTSRASSATSSPAVASTPAAAPPPMPPPSQAGAGLNAILDEAAALGLTTPALVTKMLNNVEYGRFTADHYIKMWRTRIAEHKAANPAAPAAAPRGGAGGGRRALPPPSGFHFRRGR